MYNPSNYGYSPYGYGGGFGGVSSVPQGVFQQLGGALQGVGQQAATWMPLLQQQAQGYWQNQGQMALQAYQLAETLDPNATPERKRARAVQLQDSLSRNPLYRGFQIPTTPVSQQPSNMGPISAQQPPPGSPFVAPGTPVTPPPQQTIPALPPGGGPYGGSWVPSLGPQSPQIPSMVPGTAGLPAPTNEARNLQAATGPPAQAAPPTVPTPAAVTPTPQRAAPVPYQAPTTTQQIAVSQTLGQETPRQLWAGTPGRLQRLQQLTGTADVLDRPVSEVAQAFPEQWRQAMAEVPGGSVADFLQQQGIPMSPSEQKAFAGLPLSAPSFQTNGMYDQAKVLDFAQRYQTYGADAAIRGLQVQREKLAILSDQQKYLYTQQKAQYDDLIQRYAAAQVGGDPAKAQRVLGLAPNQGLSADIVRLQGDQMVTDYRSKELVPVRGPISGNWYELPQREAFASEYQAARLSNEQAGLQLRRDEYALAQKRFGATELGTEIKIDQALQNAQKLTTADTQVLTFLRSANFQMLPDAEKRKLAERGAAIMRSKMGVNVLPDDFFTPAKKAPTPDQQTGQQFIGKLIGAALRKIGINTPLGQGRPSQPPAQPPPMTVPALGGGPITPQANAFYRIWLETGQPISAQTWAKLDAATKRQLDNAGVGHP